MCCAYNCSKYAAGKESSLFLQVLTAGLTLSYTQGMITNATPFSITSSVGRVFSLPRISTFEGLPRSQRRGFAWPGLLTEPSL